MVERISRLSGVCCVNAIVFSEVVYIHLREMSSASTEALKRNPMLVKSVDLSNVEDVLLSCIVLGEDAGVLRRAALLIREYGLLPNDALILATAGRYGCQVATLDEYMKKVASEIGLDVVEEAA